MQAGRQAVERLTDPAFQAEIQQLFGAGTTAADIHALVTDPKNQAYFALGAIGPDLFFLMPDFKPPAGPMMWGLANTVRDLFTWWDDDFWGPWTSAMDPVTANAGATVNGLSGGLIAQLNTIAGEASAVLRDFALVLGSRNVDVFGLLGCGVAAGFDEKTFFWSDMLHYRKTYRFARSLWQLANDIASGTSTNPAANGFDTAHAPSLKAYALGWMTHLATDVAGHCFVNEKCGGPYRLHWQRHHLVENHIDAAAYDAKFGSGTHWQMLSTAAMHLWIAFDDSGNGRNGVDGNGNSIPVLFDDTSRPQYPLGDSTADALGRHAIFDVDSKMPPFLATFIVNTLHAVYDPQPQDRTDGTAQTAPHPTILATTVTDGKHADGFPTAEDVQGTYWWLYHYVKYTTTDFWKLRRPDFPTVQIPQPPSPPYSGTSEPIVAADASFSETAEDVLFAILAFLIYGAECVAYAATALEQIIASGATLPARIVLYELFELPLYNMWAALHYYMASVGYVMPMKDEITTGLTTLGSGIDSEWSEVFAALQTQSGDMSPHTQTAAEPSGNVAPGQYPRDVVEDTPGLLTTMLSHLPGGNPLPHCTAEPKSPSEFLRPWRYPLHNNDASAVPIELPPTIASPFHTGADPTVLLGGAPGDAKARSDFEKAQSEAGTNALTSGANFAAGKHLGDPVDYSVYVMSKLTPKNADAIADFNLDSDRGYGHLVWDWRRSATQTGRPAHFQPGSNDYTAPLAPGTGWCADDLVPGGTGLVPVMHDLQPTVPVEIRYIGHENRIG